MASDYHLYQYACAAACLAEYAKVGVNAVTAKHCANDNCTMCSAAVCAWYASEGRIRVDCTAMRIASGNFGRKWPDGTMHYGTSLADAEKALASVGAILTYRPALEAWSLVDEWVRDGRWVILQGDYDQVPAPYTREATFKGDHSVAVGWDGRFLVHDSLTPGSQWGRTSPHARWPESVLRAYAEKLGAGRCFAGYVSVLPDTGAVDVPSPTDKPYLLADLLGGGTLYADQEGAQVLVPAFGAANGVHLYGYAHPRTGKTALAPIQVQLHAGGAVQVGWIGEDKLANVRLPGAPDFKSAFNQGVDAAVDAANAAHKP